MLKPAMIVALIFIAFIGGIGIWDTLATFSDGRFGTISSYIVEWSSRWPLLPLGTGFILGHLFFPSR